jgi:16S rRNA (uracil1498-N3)-methyltransferase
VVSHRTVVPLIVSEKIVNSLLLFPSDFVAPDRAVLSGERARAVQSRHQLGSGATVAALLFGVERLRVSVESVGADTLTLAVRERSPAPERPPAVAIVGISRPQTIKKVIQGAALFGVTELHFVRGIAGEKSYLQSHSLGREEMQDEIELGLEQACDPIPPRISVWTEHRAWEKALIDRIVTEYPKASRLLADTSSGPGGPAPVQLSGRGDPVVIAIGPEAGWGTDEVERFRAAGFRSVSLGERMLRVEHALVALLAQVQLLRSQAVSGAEAEVSERP